MAYSLLNAVNLALKRVRLIQGDAGELTSLSDGARQADIDIMVQAYGEVIRELYDTLDMVPTEVKEGSFTLVADTREYDTAADFEKMACDTMNDETDGHWLDPYPGGYAQMWRDQTEPGNYTGSPLFWCLNPTNGYIRLDTVPSSAEAGRVYKYLYSKTLRFTAATDTFPFSDQVLDDLMPAVKEVWNRESKEKFDPLIYQVSIARAAGTVTQQKPRDHW